MRTSDDGADTVDYGIPAPGHRLPAGTRVGGVRLQVSDLERSLAWYRDILGLNVIARSDGRASLGALEATVPLVELRFVPGTQPVPMRGRLGLYHFAILLPDRASLGAFVAHLQEIGAPAGASDHFVSEALYLRDPDGLGIEVYADRPRSAWRQRDRQLVMATEPLDLAALMRAGEGRPWEGMPRGTTMGHMHLHVGDLREAEAFYHVTLGLDKMVWSYPGALFLSAGGYHHHLGVNTWAAGATAPGDTDAQLQEWELVLPTSDDVERARASLVAAGHAAEASADGVLARDPWGTRLRLQPES